MVKWKTVLFNAAAVVTVVIDTLGPNVIPPEYAALTLAVINCIIAINNKRTKK